MIKFFPIRVKVSSMLHLTFAESALERVPPSLWNHPSVVKKARQAGKNPSKTLLDRTYHHRAMLKLANAAKRGRPDILHFSLLAAFGTPLNKEGLLKTYVHTVDDHIIHFNPDVRLPKNYNRFVGLIEQLFERGKIPVEAPTLLKLEQGGFQKLVEEVQPSYIIAFSRSGRLKLPQKVIDRRKEENLMVVVGAFPRGHFSKTLLDIADEVVSIDVEPLEAWIVASRILYDYERVLGLPERRLQKGLRRGAYGGTTE
jgi:rRNA small subunit pseudouridine methyltransferase Nep1